MKGVADLCQVLLRRTAPALNAALTRLAYATDNVVFGPGLRADGVPRCLVDRTATLTVGRDVELRSGVEIRVHGTARVIIEDGVRIDRGVRILAVNDAEVRIGARSRIGLHSVFNGGDSITIGASSLISGFVYLQTSMHCYKDAAVPIRDQGYDHAPVAMGEGAWLAAHVVVMPGVTIGAGAVVGSNGVVTRDVAPGEVVGGVPARALKNRDEPQA